jgi:hypothetical protein
LTTRPTFSSPAVWQRTAVSNAPDQPASLVTNLL